MTVVLVKFSDQWERGEGRLAKPGTGLIQPLCRRDGLAGRADKGRSSQVPIGPKRKREETRNFMRLDQ